jgi:hypothetical protein
MTAPDRAVAPAAAVPAHAAERVPPGEEQAIRRVLELTREKFEHDYAWVRPALRDQHPKPHGCVRAEFVVDADVPADLRHGIFAAPRTYPAWIRFSSSFSPPRSDDKRDAHGMAIKLMGVAGPKALAAERDATTQDFVLANNPVFFCRNASDYVALATNASQGHFMKFFVFPRPRPRELRNMLGATQKRVTNPLRTRYWSQTPSALGPYAVKYSATPRPTAASVPGRRPQAWDDNELRAVMARELAAGEALFDFMVQRQADPETMPVEDPTIPWSERRAPFRKVATIRIPSQAFTSKAQRDFGENLSFTPWHALPEHRPLGGINRIRGVVYEAISELRHEMNDAPRAEPAPSDGPPSLWTLHGDEDAV